MNQRWFRKQLALALAVLMLIPLIVLPATAAEADEDVLYEQDFENFAKPSNWPTLAKAENGEMSFTLGADSSDTTKVYWLKTTENNRTVYKFGTFSGTAFTEGGKDYPVTTNGNETGRIGTLTYGGATVDLYCTGRDLANYITASTQAPNINYNAVLSFDGVKAANAGKYIVVEMDYYLPSDGRGAVQIKGKTSGGDVDFCQITLGAVPVFAGAKHGGALVNAKTLKANAWNRLRFFINLENDVYEVYANGVLSVSGECKKNSFSKNGDGLKGITLWAIPRTNNVTSDLSSLAGTVKVDNVRVKKANPAEFPLTETTTESVNGSNELVFKTTGDGYVRAPFKGACTSNKVYSGNADMSLYVGNAYLRAGDIYSIELKYRPHFDATANQTPTVEVQFADYKVYNPTTKATQDCSFLSLFSINLKTGQVYDAVNQSVFSYDVRMNLDEWNTVRVEFDTATGAQRTFVNGAFAFARSGYKAQYHSGSWKSVEGATDFEVPYGKLIAVKCNKNIGAYAEGSAADYSDLNYVDFGGCTIKKTAAFSRIQLAPTEENFENLTAGATLTKDSVHFFEVEPPTGAVVWEERGNKSVRINLADKANADANPVVKNAAFSAAVHDVVALEAQYYLSADATGSIVMQMHHFSANEFTGRKMWLNLVGIDLSSGRISYYYGSTKEENLGKQILAREAWNTVTMLLNPQGGGLDVYVNGVYDGSCNVGYTGISVPANEFIVGKVLKNQTLTGFYAVDNVRSYTPAEDFVTELPATDANGNTLNYVEINGQKIGADRVLKGTDYKAVYFDGSVLNGIIASVDKASVRLDAHAGLRFATYINQEKINAVHAKAERGEIAGYRIGTLITLDSYRRIAGGGTREALEALAERGNRGKTYIDVEATYNVWFDHAKAGLTASDGEAVFAGTITDIMDAHLSVPMYGVGYVEIYTLAGKTAAVYGAGHTASVAEKAQTILDGVLSGYTEEEIALLNGFVNGHVPTAREQQIEALRGMNVLALGDSLFYGAQTTIGEKQWLNRLGKEASWHLTNLGIGGMTVSLTPNNATAPRDSMYDRMFNTDDFVYGTKNERYYNSGNPSGNPEDVELILLEGGCNDYGSAIAAPLGTVDSRDSGTYLGAWNLITERLLAAYPNAKLVFVTTWNLGGSQDRSAGAGDNLTSMEFSRSIITLYNEKYASNSRVALIDAGDPAVSGVDMNNTTWRNTYSYDNYHLNDEGMKLMAERMLPLIWEIMRKK